MGGCCSSSRKAQLHGTPIYYYCPPISEEHGTLTSHDEAATALTAGFLVDLNLESSFPDGYRSPPIPLPYDMVFGHSQAIDSESVKEVMNDSSRESLASSEDHDESDLNTQSEHLLVLPMKPELCKLSEPIASSIEEEDLCPICLEEYDEENPRTITKCQHYFHLSCILEWMERSDTCAICDQEMAF